MNIAFGYIHKRRNGSFNIIDGKTVADGKPGPMTNRLREIYVDFARATARVKTAATRRRPWP